jgi:CO/xanthine dehydrogenase FAD-binding subunit
MSATSFVSPTDLASVLQALSAGGVAIAGGTDLVVGHRQGKRPLPDSVVAIDRVAELRGICGDDTAMAIGSMTSHDDVVLHDSVRAKYTSLADASSIVGSEATRSTGTLGGNLMNGSPAADTVGPLLCHGGVAVLRSATGERRVPIAELLVSPGRTSAQPGELLTMIELPEPAPRTGSAYVRLEFRRHMEIAVVGATAVVTLDDSGSVTDARIAITALSPTIRRMPEAEASLIGKPLDRTAADAAGALVASGSSPISDVRASADYRQAMAAVITRRALLAAAARARGEHIVIPASDSTFGAQS